MDSHNIEIEKIFKQEGAILEGLFKLSSGLYSDIYIQCALIMRQPKIAKQLCGILASKISDFGITADSICSPAMGGLLVGYEVASQLNLPNIFLERVAGNFELRRGFQITEGQKFILCEDVVTTAKSSMEAISLIQGQGGKVVAVCSLINRSNKTNPFDSPNHQPSKLSVDDGGNGESDSNNNGNGGNRGNSSDTEGANIGNHIMPYFSLLNVKANNFQQGEIPDDLKHLEAIKPGSRFLAKNT